MLKWIAGLGLLAALVAVLTRPSEADVDEALRAALYERLLTAEVEEGREILGNAALVACRIDPSACFEVLRQGLDVTYVNNWLYAVARVDGFGREATCYGAFTRFFCPDGLQPVEDG